MWHLVCLDEGFNGGTCITTGFVYSQSLLPTLSLSDGLQISGLIVGVWVLAYCFKSLRKFIARG